jgi:cytochrome c553
MPLRPTCPGLALSVVAALAMTWLAAPAWSAEPPREATRAGESIYRTGHLADGTPVTAERESGMEVSGRVTACMNCHQRSGLGAREGQVSVPPVAGSYLFNPKAGTADSLELPFVENMRPDREPYTEASLAAAIRDGIANDGRLMSYLMPHYRLDDAQMASLIAYLRTLSPGKTPGVESSLLHFATIVTPEADPKVRQGVRAVLEQFFADKNHYTRSQSPRMQSNHRMRFKVNLHWQLHVWELKGPPSGWEAQLRAKLASDPVYAVIGSVGGSHWEPIHRFCESAELPCLFPVIDAPVDDDKAFDNIYFSRGVLLEADLIAHDLKARAAGEAPRRVVQFLRQDDVGEPAAARLASDLSGSIPVEERRFPAHASARELAAAVTEVAAADAVVLWLRPGDLAALGPVPAGLKGAYVSARMGGLESAPLPAAWRAKVLMAYPLDLPEHRRVQVDYPLGWFRLRRIPVVAEQQQADAYLGCIILSDTLNHMVDTFVRDYLVERIQEGVQHRILTGYYPRLTLSLGQSFASKGGYLVRFPEPAGERVVPVGGWVTP